MAYVIHVHRVKPAAATWYSESSSQAKTTVAAIVTFEAAATGLKASWGYSPDANNYHGIMVFDTEANALAHQTAYAANADVQARATYMAANNITETWNSIA